MELNQDKIFEDVVTWLRRGSRSDPSQPPALREDPLPEGVTVAVCTYKRADSLIRLLDSLPSQEPRPQRLVIVDASPDEEAEQAFRDFEGVDQLADDVLYFRVCGRFETLTCSRNFALRWASTDLVVFFDDDVVLKPGCLREMERPFREAGDQVVGVGGYATNFYKKPSLKWRLRKRLRMVSSLQPGSFARSGISIPWSMLDPTDELVEGEWLSGCAMMWKTTVARQVRFNEGFGGHSTGEDLDFGLRMGRHGELLMAGKAHLLHLTESGGRPNLYRMGYTAIRNAYDIHRRCLPNRTWKDGFWFAYAYGMDAVMHTAILLFSRNRLRRFDFLRGRFRFLREAISGQFQLSRNPD